MQDQFRQPLRLKQGPDSKSKRQNLSGHGQSPKHPSSQELSVSIRTSATACVYERRPHPYPCDGEIRMRIVKKFVTAHADLDGEIRMRIVKKFRDCACGLRSRREGDHRGEGGQAQRKKQKCTQSKHCCGSGHGRASLGKGS